MNVNSLAIGSWPSLCERAMKMAAEEMASGRRDALNRRLGRRLGLSEASARRITGVYPAIRKMAEATGTMAELAKIPYASAMIIATWHARDPQGALQGLRMAVDGLGSGPLREMAGNRKAAAAKRPRRERATEPEPGSQGERDTILWTMALGSPQIHQRLAAMSEDLLRSYIEIDERDGLGAAHRILKARHGKTKRSSGKRPVAVPRQANAPDAAPPEGRFEGPAIGAGDISDIAAADKDVADLVVLKIASGRLDPKAARRIGMIARVEPSRCQAALQTELAAAERAAAKAIKVVPA